MTRPALSPAVDLAPESQQRRLARLRDELASQVIVEVCPRRRSRRRAALNPLLLVSPVLAALGLAWHVGRIW